MIGAGARLYRLQGYYKTIRKYPREHSVVTNGKRPLYLGKDPETGKEITDWDSPPSHDEIRKHVLEEGRVIAIQPGSVDIGLADIDKGGEAALDDVKALLGTPLAAFKSRVLDDDAFHVLYRKPDDKIGGPAHCYGETRINSGYAAIWDICEWASAVKAAPDAARTDFGPLLAKRAGVGGEAKGRHDTLRDRLVAAQKAGDLTDDLFAKYRAEHVEAVGDDRDGGEEADKLLAWVKANVESKPNPEGMTIETLVAECENDPGRAFKEDALAFAASLSKPDFMRLQGLLKDAKVSPIGDWRKDVARVKDAGDEGPETVEPWSEEVDGAELLDALVAIFKRYASMPDGGPEAAAAWAMFAWCHDAFGVSPIFMASAPERACGKTRVTEILSWMVPRPKPVFAASVAAIVRGIEAWCPSLLFDEAQTIFTSKGESAEYMRQLLTASFNRQFAFVDKCVGDDHEPVSFATFCPRAVNGREIHKLEDMLTSRSIVVIMERAEPGSLERLRAEVDPVGEEIRSKAARWRDDNIDDVRECDPEMPAGCDDRWADIWRPLFAIAEIAGGGWAVRIATAAGALTVGKGAVDTIKVELLRDIRTIFEARGNPDFLTSKEIHKDLFNMEERPWGIFDKGKAMNNKQRAKLLESFKIKSEQKKFEGNKNLRGYYRKAFAEAWRRYLSAGNGPEPGGSGTGSGPATGDSGTGSAAKPNDNNGVAENEGFPPHAQEATGGPAESRGPGCMYEKDANTRAEIIAKHGSHNERVKKAIRMTRNLVDGKNMLPARARDRAARYFGVAPRDIPARM